VSRKTHFWATVYQILVGSPSCFTPLFPLPTIKGERHCVFGVVRRSVRPSVNTYVACHNISLFSGGISIKRVSVHFWRGFQSQGSEVRIKCTFPAYHRLTAVRPLSVRWRHADRRCGVEAHLLSIARFVPKIVALKSRCRRYTHRK